MSHADIPRVIGTDGGVHVDGQYSEELLLRGFNLNDFIFSEAANIVAYNQQCQLHDKMAFAIGVTAPALPPLADRLRDWWISEPYASLDIRTTLLARCTRDEERQRVEAELQLFADHQLLPVLRLMFMLVDTFREHKVVTGVGRGSSVASYVLYLIGVHHLDSLAYDLPISEFLHD
jgi:DNA polymerase III alpha subunit